MDGTTTTVASIPQSTSFGIDGDAIALIPPGEYDLKFQSWKTAVMFGRAPKLILYFSVCTFGDHFEVVLPRYYNVTRLVGKPQQYGGFKVGRSSDMIREYASMFRLPPRLDRIPMSAFQNPMFRGKVVTVTQGRDQSKIPEQLQYSKIERLWVARS